MNTYEVRLRPLSPFRTPPRAPGLFGHIAWAIRYRDGKEALETWLESFLDTPPLRFSSAFPTGYLPRPLLPPQSVTETDLRKKLKTVSYLPIDLFRRVAEQGEQALVSHFKDRDKDRDVETPGWTPATRTRVTIDRSSGGALEGALYNEAALWFGDTPSTLSVYLRGDKAAVEHAIDALRLVGNLGYGGKASIGMGHFRLEGHDQTTLPEANDANYAVSLAPVLPRAEMGGWWRTETYWGRLGGHFVTEAKPFKRPHLRVVEGSTLDLETQGGMLDVTNDPPPEPGVRIRDYLYAFPLGVRVS